MTTAEAKGVDMSVTYDFSWRESSKHRLHDATVDAQAVGEALQNIDDSLGTIRPSMVVNVAENPSSPLHTLFEWDDTEAAKEHRLHQARQVLGCLAYVVVTKPQHEPMEVRAIANVKVGGNQTNRMMDAVLADPDMLASQIRDAGLSLRSWHRQFQVYYEYLPTDLQMIMDDANAYTATIKRRPAR